MLDFTHLINFVFCKYTNSVIDQNLPCVVNCHFSKQRNHRGAKMLLLISANQTGDNNIGHPRYLGTLLSDTRRRLETLGDARIRPATKGNPHEKPKGRFWSITTSNQSWKRFPSYFTFRPTVFHIPLHFKRAMIFMIFASVVNKKQVDILHWP